MVQKLSAVRAPFHRSRVVQIVLFDAVVSISFCALSQDNLVPVYSERGSYRLIMINGKII